MSDRVEAIRALWSAGSYEDVGAFFVPITDAVVGALGLRRLAAVRAGIVAAWESLARPAEDGVALPAGAVVATVAVAGSAGR
jgi:hypothetical protein